MSLRDEAREVMAEGIGFDCDLMECPDPAGHAEAALDALLDWMAGYKGEWWFEHLAPFLASALRAEGVLCPACGDLKWTLRDYNRVTHKHACEYRVDPYCQTHPDQCDESGGTDA